MKRTLLDKSSPISSESARFTDSQQTTLVADKMLAE
jgi:hypothetical protein